MLLTDSSALDASFNLMFFTSQLRWSAAGEAVYTLFYSDSMFLVELLGKRLIPRVQSEYKVMNSVLDSRIRTDISRGECIKGYRLCCVTNGLSLNPAWGISIGLMGIDFFYLVYDSSRTPE